MKSCNPGINDAIDSSVMVAVLAAGSATRFGSGKLDADLCGRPVGRWATNTAERAGFVRRLIVSAPDKPAFISELKGWECATNHSPAQGLPGSIKLAAHAARHCRRLVIILADMPFIEQHHLGMLASAHGIMFTQYPTGKLGVPASFPARCLSQLRELSGHDGAAAADWGEAVQHLVPRCALSLRDVDTQNDIVALRKLVSAAS